MSNLSNPIQLAEVTQADRDAAAAYLRSHPLVRGTDEYVARRYERGEMDDAPLIKSHARHRLSSLRSLQSEVERLTAREQSAISALREITNYPTCLRPVLIAMEALDKLGIGHRCTTHQEGDSDAALQAAEGEASR